MWFEALMIVMQLGAMVEALFTDQRIRALYWLGAVILTFAVMEMKRV